MSAVWFRAWGLVRSNVRSTLALTLLVAIGATATLTALAGARRTHHAVPEFVDYAENRRIGVFAAPPDDVREALVDDGSANLAALRALPEVERAGRLTSALGAVAEQKSPTGWREVLTFIALDDFGDVGRPIVVDGVLPSNADTDRIAVNEVMARRSDLRVGSHLTLALYTIDQFGPASAGAPDVPDGARRDVTVGAIIRMPSDLQPERANDTSTELGLDHSTLYATPAFWSAVTPNGPDVARYGDLYSVALHESIGARAQFSAHLAPIFGQGNAGIDRAQPGYDVASIDGVERESRLASLGLVAFAVISLATAILVVGQALARQVAHESTETATLRAIGMRPQQLIAIVALRSAIVGLAGTAVAVVATVALSGFMPMGTARRAEMHPGVEFDRLVLVPGALLLLVFVVLGGGATAWFALRRRRAVTVPDAGTKWTRRLSPARLPITVGTGVRLASTRGAPPITAAIAGVIAVVAAVTFRASVARVEHDPARYGVTWDAVVGSYGDFNTSLDGKAKLDANPNVASYLGTQTSPLTLDGVDVTALFVMERHGSVPLTVIEGRPPQGSGEIAVGTTTLTTLHKHIGDTVALSALPGVPDIDLRIVGRAATSAPGDLGVEPGKVAIIDGSITERVDIGRILYASNYVVEFAAGSDRAAAVESLRRDFYATTITRLDPPTAFRNVQRVVSLPSALALVVALLATGTLVHSFVSTTRRRRHEFAVLKTIGFTRGQLRAAVAWQATAVAAVAVVVGFPLGLAVGRLGWRMVGNQIGLVSAPATPAFALVVVGLGAALLVNTVAALPGSEAARLRPADLLRTE
jgi:ABC-type antimicrobial peptide transport system permease subunit